MQHSEIAMLHRRNGQLVQHLRHGADVTAEILRETLEFLRSCNTATLLHVRPMEPGLGVYAPGTLLISILLYTIIAPCAQVTDLQQS